MTTNDTNLATDVIVIGGGPGGSTTATMLARKGLRVLLLERDRFPRQHIGESLLPASVPVLEELGVLPAVQEAGFLPKWGATMVWGKEDEPWSWYFRETNSRNPHSYQVWRPHFDQLLLENSRAHGVDVREGHHVHEVLFEGARATGVVYSPEDGPPRTATARWIVDASGQHALLGHKLNLRRWDTSFQNLAVYAYFTGEERLPPPDDTNIFIESYPSGWFWTIPLHVGWSSVGAVVDSRAGQEGLRRSSPERFLMQQIAEAPHTARMLRNATMAHGPFVLKDWSYVSDEVVGDGYILVGDAACFIDPLFSSGVHLALMAGVLAAAYVTTALKDESLREPAGRVYKELYYTQYGHFREMARLFYSSNQTIDSYFWEARRILGEDDRFSPRQAFIRAVAGQPPQGYERVVLERGEAPEAFVRSVRMVEAERAARRERMRQAQANGDIAQHPLLRAVPVLAADVTVERKPVLGEGEFAWGHVLTSPGRPEGVPCSALVASMLAQVDGQTPLSAIAARLRQTYGGEPGGPLDSNVLNALQILYIEGAIDELRET